MRLEGRSARASVRPGWEIVREGQARHSSWPCPVSRRRIRRESGQSANAEISAGWPGAGDEGFVLIPPLERAGANPLEARRQEENDLSVVADPRIQTRDR